MGSLFDDAYHRLERSPSLFASRQRIGCEFVTQGYRIVNGRARK